MFQLEIVYLDQFDYQRASARSTNTENLPPKYQLFRTIVSVNEDITLRKILQQMGLKDKELENYTFRKDNDFQFVKPSAQVSIEQKIRTFLNDSSALVIFQENSIGVPLNPVLQYRDHERLNTDIAQSTADILLLNIGSNPRHPEDNYQEKPDFVEQAKAKGQEIAIFNIDPDYRNFFKEDNGDYFKNRYMVHLDPYFFQSQKLLSILQEKMKKGIKVIICDNAMYTLTAFTRELGAKNLDQFQHNLAVMTFYFQVSYNHIALVFSSDYFKQRGRKGFEDYISQNMSDTILGEKWDELGSYVTNKLQKELLQQFGFHVYNKQEDIVLHNHLDLKPRLSFSKLSQSSTSSSDPLVSDVVATEKASNIRQRP